MQDFPGTPVLNSTLSGLNAIEGLMRQKVYHTRKEWPKFEDDNALF